MREWLRQLTHLTVEAIPYGFVLIGGLVFQNPWMVAVGAVLVVSRQLAEIVTALERRR